MKKRTTAALLAAMLSLALAFNILPVRVFADDVQEREIWLTDGGEGYYYGQLDEKYQSAWRADVNSIFKYPRLLRTKKRNIRLEAVCTAIKLDNPKLFWVDWIDAYSRMCYYIAPEKVEKSNLYSPVWPKGKKLADLKETYLKALDNAVDEITAVLPENAGERATAKAIAKWLCDNNFYNHDQTGPNRKDPLSFDYLAAHSSYSALVTGDRYTPVCEGYATAFKVLCDEVGINCICVSGESEYNGRHIWNYIEIGGKWYLVDVTNIDNDGDSSAYWFSKFFMNNFEARYYTPDPYLGSGINPDNGYGDELCAKFEFPELYQKSSPSGIAFSLIDAEKAELTKSGSGYVLTVSAKDISSGSGVNILISESFLPASADWLKSGWSIKRYAVKESRGIGFASYPGDAMKKQIQIAANTPAGEYTYRFKAADSQNAIYETCTVDLTIKITE